MVFLAPHPRSKASACQSGDRRMNPLSAPSAAFSFELSFDDNLLGHSSHSARSDNHQTSSEELAIDRGKSLGSYLGSCDFWTGRQRAHVFLGNRAQNSVVTPASACTTLAAWISKQSGEPPSSRCGERPTRPLPEPGRVRPPCVDCGAAHAFFLLRPEFGVATTEPTSNTKFFFAGGVQIRHRWAFYLVGPSEKACKRSATG